MCVTKVFVYTISVATVCFCVPERRSKAHLGVSLTAKRLARLHLLHRADLHTQDSQPSVSPVLKKIHAHLISFSNVFFPL